MGETRLDGCERGQTHLSNANKTSEKKRLLNNQFSHLSQERECEQVIVDASIVNLCICLLRN